MGLMDCDVQCFKIELIKIYLGKDENSGAIV